ncbi:MAG: hypothetical protein HDT30_12495 [Clostridiales bacterium]|nr:hypothetical protein [Clostridiales bacterium]
MEVKIKRKICLLLMFVLACSTLVSCSGSGSTNKGKRDTTYTIVDTTSGSNASVVFNTTKKTVVVKNLWYDVPEVGTKLDISSKKAVSYSGTYGAGKTVSFHYNAKYDNTVVYVTMTIPKKGNKAAINYSFSN